MASCVGGCFALLISSSATPYADCVAKLSPPLNLVFWHNSLRSGPFIDGLHHAALTDVSNIYRFVFCLDSWTAVQELLIYCHLLQ